MQWPQTWFEAASASMDMISSSIIEHAELVSVINWNWLYSAQQSSMQATSRTSQGMQVYTMKIKLKIKERFCMFYFARYVQ